MKFKSYLILHCTLVFSALFGNQSPEQIVILGSGPAGCTAAIYTSRAGLAPLMIEGSSPPQVISAEIIENFPGFPESINGRQLLDNMRTQALRFGTRIESRDLTAVDLSSSPFVLTFKDGETISTQVLILALGSTEIKLGLESENALIGHGISFCTTCDAFLYMNKAVVVVGDGDMALEEALDLANYAAKVTIIPQGSSLKASKALKEQVEANDKIQVIWNCSIEEIKDRQEDTVTGVVLKDMKTTQTQYLSCDGVFIALGYRPNTDLFQGQLELTKDGSIVLKPFSTETSVTGVFAAGNVTDTRYRQTITAAGAGCMAGLDAYHFIQKLNEGEQNQ
jgi:thioredoxin reductase (NADPH)